MAMIDSIRKRGWLALVFVGLGMLLFLIPPDAINSLTGKGANRDIIRSAGKSMGATEWTNQLQTRRNLFNYTNNEMGLLNDVFNDFVEQSILESDYQEIGLKVTEEEFEGVLFGEILSPYVKRTFYNNLDSLSLKETMRKNFDDMRDNQYENYIGYKNMIIQRRMKEKYDQMIKRGLYANNIEAKFSYKFAHDTVSVQFIAKKYEEMADSLVSYDEGDLRAYYNKHKNDEDWKQVESRSVEYLSFPVQPSAADSAALITELKGLAEMWTKESDDSSFVVKHSITPNFVQLDYHDGDFPGPENVNIMTDSIGSVVGPYIDNNFLRIVRVRDRKMDVDSVKARHILLKGDLKTEKAKLMARADSIKKVISASKNFEDMAKQFGTDGTKDKGGDLGWFGRGQMVKPFEEACFNGAIGQLQTVESQFGIHVVEVTEKKAPMLTAKLVVLDREIKPSTATISGAYNLANDVSLLYNDTSKIRDYADTSGLSMVPAANLTRTSTAVGALQDATEIVRWSFREDAEVGTVSQPFQIGEDYIIAVLTEIKEKGSPSFENVKDRVKKELINEKKAEAFIAKIKDANNLQEAATALETQVKTADVNMVKNNIPSSGVAGNEFETIGLCFGIPQGKMSVPVQGKGGVFMIAPAGPLRSGPQTADFIEDQDKLIKNLQGRASVQIFNALKEAADVEDLRFDE